MRWATLLIALGILAAALPALADLNLPQVEGVTVRALVEPEPEDPAVLQFSYRIDNTTGSLPLDALALDLTSDASRLPSDSGGLVMAEEVFPSSSRNAERFGPTGLTASAFPTVPTAWMVGIDPRGRARWSVADESQQVAVGSSRDEFVLQSRALPAVREVEISADLFDALPDAQSIDDPDALFEAADSAAQRVRTVGPLAPPVEIDFVALADTLESYRVAAVEEGWIRDGVTHANLRGLLDSVRSDLGAGNVGQARSSLIELLSLVDSESCAAFECSHDLPLSSEARALLGMNGFFLLKQLPNAPPVCEAAAASPAVIWPPNKKFVPVEVAGVADGDQDPLQVSITSVIQDEPTDSTCPSAIPSSEGLEIWAERLGIGDGRIYKVSFTATDPVDAECSGVVEVCVPHDQGDGECIDSELEVDATSCP